MLNRRRLRILAMMAFLLTANGFGAGKLIPSSAVGSIARIKGTVLVDQQTPMLRETVFTGDVLSTGAGSGAILNLRSGVVATLVENSELLMTGTGDLTLVKGAVVIRKTNAGNARVNVPGASVVVGGDGTFPSICRIASVDKSAAIIADKGHVEIHGAGAPTIAPLGKTVHLENGVPQAATQPEAGKVVAAQPQDFVQHGTTGAPNPLNVPDTVHWEDVVKTKGAGRVRIQLLDGSFLNVGVRSEMRIVKHDADSQQTVIELTAGKLRNEVVPQTKPGHNFETRTPTAVIGVVGTTVLADAKPKVTKVWSVKDDVDVRNIDPKVPGHVTLHTGQFTTVHFGLPPTPPITLSPGQIQNETNHTEVHQGPPTGGTPGGPTGAGANAGIANTVSNGAATLAATGVSAGLTGAAISKNSGANNSLQTADNALANAGNQLNQATTSSNSAAQANSQAAGAATQAANIATETATQIQIIQQQGCGCVSPPSPQ